MSATANTSTPTRSTSGATPSVEIRAKLVHALNLDLVGPPNDSDLAWETLPQAPSRWYLTGFLAPLGANAEQRSETAVGLTTPSRPSRPRPVAHFTHPPSA